MDWFDNIVDAAFQPANAEEHSVEWHNNFGTGPDFSELALGDSDISSPGYCWSARSIDE